MKLSERLQAAQLRSEVPGATLRVPPAPKHSPAAVMQTPAVQAAAHGPVAPLQTQSAGGSGTVAPRQISGVSTYQTRAARRAAEAAAQAAAAQTQAPSSAPVTAAPAASAPTRGKEHGQSGHAAPLAPAPVRRQPVQTVPVQPAPAAQKPQQPVDVFAALKQRAATALFERMGARFNDSSLTEQELRRTAREELIRIIDAEQVPLTPDERTRLVADVADDVLGYGPLQRLLDDNAVTEIMVNRMDQIYVERKGQLTLTDSRFSSEEHLRKVIERIVSKVGRRIDESSPLVDARLADGSRVNAVIPPLAFGGSSLTIRKFAKDPFQVADLIGFGTLSPE